MPTITDADVTFYVENGYLVTPGMFGREDLDRIKAEAVKFARRQYRALNPPPKVDPDAPDDEALRNILAVHFPHWVSTVIRSYVDHPALADVLHRITAAHLPHWDGSVKCMQSMLFTKPPGYQGQAWHQDERYIPTRDRSLVGAWIALDDATVDNGCLWVLPQSNQTGYLYPTRYHEQPEEFDWADESYGFEDSGEVPVEVDAGSVVYFNGYLLHRSKKNRSDSFRRALVNHYCNAYSLLPWPSYPEKIEAQSIGVYDNRMVVPVGADPYAWKGYTDPPQVVYLRPREGKHITPTT